MDKKYVVLKNVSKKLKGVEILKNVNMEISQGSVIGLTGINGSGKSMLLRAIAGLIHVKGEISINGELVGENKSPESIGVMIEMPGFLPEFTGRQNLELLGMIQQGVEDSDIKEALAAVGLDYNDKRTYHKYSLGMKERLAIAQAILRRPKLILLDEPTNAIDEDGIHQLLDVITGLKESGCTIVIASHDKEFLSKAVDVSYRMTGGELSCEK